MRRPLDPADQLPSDGETLAHEHSWSNSCLKTYVIFRELDQDLLHASHLKEEPKKKTGIL